MSNGDSEVVKRLDILIRLLAVAIADEDWPQRKKIQMLSKAGLGSRDIAEFLDTTPNTVSVAISNLKKDKKRRAARPAEPSSKESSDE